MTHRRCCCGGETGCGGCASGYNVSFTYTYENPTDGLCEQTIAVFCGSPMSADDLLWETRLPFGGTDQQWGCGWNNAGGLIRPPCTLAECTPSPYVAIFSEDIGTQGVFGVEIRYSEPNADSSETYGTVARVRVFAPAGTNCPQDGTYPNPYAFDPAQWSYRIRCSDGFELNGSSHGGIGIEPPGLTIAAV